MTETTELPTTGRVPRGSGLSGMVLADLKALAGQLGMKGTSAMRKGDLVAAIAAHQQKSDGPAQPAGPGSAEVGARPERGRRVATRRAGAPDQPTLTELTPPAPAENHADRNGHDGHNGHVGRPAADTAQRDGANTAQRDGASGADTAQRDGAKSADSAQRDGADSAQRDGDQGRDRGQNRRNRRSRRDRDADGASGEQHERPHNGSSDSNGHDGVNGRDGQTAADERTRPEEGSTRTSGGDTADDRQSAQGRSNQDRSNQDRTNQDRNNQDQSGRHQDNRRDDDDSDGGGRRRGRRYRDRNRRGRDRFSESNEPEVREDDVLLPVSGIVDVLDSYAFVRTSGYLSGPNDVYVSMSQVRKYGLRRGDSITGAIRAPRDGEQPNQRQKFNPLVKLETINGLDPEAARGRPEFTKLTPLYPNERLRLETESHILTTRVIDLVMPVGKGQRALIVSPPKAGKTSVLQAIANAITTNNPECHLMVVLVDERPEEVTDMQRSVRGEVIASTFDRPPNDHTMVAELSIERAKRLVEQGKDVVVLLDSITRLGRAYNLAAPASGRILSGGVDSTALFPPKRFLGAARNIENGGSLTIFASALVETGSAGDTVIFEEFKGTGNAELKLDRRLADKRLFPAIDIDASSTRKEELLMSPDELAVTVKLRRLLSALEPQQALELVLERLRKTRTNIEFLMTVAKNMPMTDSSGH